MAGVKTLIPGQTGITYGGTSIRSLEAGQSTSPAVSDMTVDELIAQMPESFDSSHNLIELCDRYAGPDNAVIPKSYMKRLLLGTSSAGVFVVALSFLNPFAAVPLAFAAAFYGIASTATGTADPRASLLCLPESGRYQATVFPALGTIYQKGYPHYLWKRLVEDFLLTEKVRGCYHRTDLACRRTEEMLEERYGLTLKQLRKGEGLRKKVDRLGPAYLYERDEDKTVPFTGKDVAEIFAWRSGRYSPDEISQCAAIAWTMRALGKGERLKFGDGNIAGAAEFFNAFAEKMTGEPAPSMRDEKLNVDQLDMEYSGDLRHLLQDIEFYTSNNLPTPLAAALAYCARYYDRTGQTENALSMFNGLRLFLEGEKDEFAKHNNDVLARLRAESNACDENDVLIELHGRLAPG